MVYWNLFCVMLLGFIVDVESLHCYKCENISTTHVCDLTESCPAGQRCFTRTSGVGVSETFELGCKPEVECLPDAGRTIIGRSLVHGNNCFQCCNVDNCNVNLCSAGIQVINEVGQCQDDASFDCAQISSVFDICRDIHHAKLKCRKYCGLCDLLDGSWSEWSSWGKCDVTCGYGNISRVRSCTNPQPAHGGLDCIGDAVQIVPCNLSPCPVNGGWSPWSSWASCSVTCGIGLSHRDRTCSNPHPKLGGDHCFGVARDYRPCLTKACTDGVWSMWSDWGSCSSTCLGGIQKRQRTCDNPTPSVLGHVCAGNSIDYQPCNNVQCQKDSVVLFRATQLSSINGGINRTLIYTKTEVNEGGGYDNTSGIFTAPVSGVYMFVIQACIFPGQYHHIHLVKNGHIEFRTSYNNHNYYFCPSSSALVSLLPRDRVWVSYTSAGSLEQNLDYVNMFQGTKISD